jgi:hypothetical protein
MAQASSGTARALVLIMVIVLGLVAYSLYQDSVLEGQVQSLQLQNNELGLSLQAQELRIELLMARTSTTASTPLRFQITSVCVSVGQECPPSGAGQGAGYAYSFGVKDTGATPILGTESVYLRFNDTTHPYSFGFNSTLPGDIAPNSTAYLQGTAWPTYTNATSKLSPGDSVGVLLMIGSVGNDIATAVLSCTSSTSTTTTGNSTMTQTSTCS